MPYRSLRVVLNNNRIVGHKKNKGKRFKHESRIRLAIWNIGTLTEKMIELVDTMIRRRINIICLHETKWAGEKSREIENYWI